MGHVKARRTRIIRARNVFVGLRRPRSNRGSSRETRAARTLAESKRGGSAGLARADAGEWPRNRRGGGPIEATAARAHTEGEIGSSLTSSRPAPFLYMAHLCTFKQMLSD